MRRAALVSLLAVWPAVAQSDAARLHQLFASEWERSLKASPTFASSQGDKRFNALWPDHSLPALAAESQARQSALAALAKIRRSNLSPADQLNYDLFQYQLQDAEQEYSLGWHLVPINTYSGIQGLARTADNLTFQSEKDYRDWLERLRRFPALAKQTIALMREGMRRKLLQPRLVMERAAAQIERQIVSDPALSPFYKPFRQTHPSLTPASQQQLRAAAQSAVTDQILPAQRELIAFLRNEYIPACYETPGIWNLLAGPELYAYFARHHTTTKLTPNEIHDIGLREVARIRDEMHSVLQQTGFSGTLAQFFDHLRTDPRFFFRDPQDLLTAYRATAKRMDPLLPRLFINLPRLPYGVEPIPAELAPDTTTAHYSRGAADGSRAGTYAVNLYQPASRPKWEIVALTLHEAVPGHHLQVSRSMELTGLPNFRRHLSVSAYTEGWGLYAESLGQEMGLYKDPYDKFGRLTYDMWRAVRLVVDTGIHAKRWSRQQAIDYFMANAPKAKLDIENEVDRYIGWPGQALGYKIGELRIQALRRRAEESLKQNFDLREFHDTVLATGPVPLDILETAVNAWIKAKTPKP